MADGVWIQGDCFGCGPANAHGLQLRSSSAGRGVRATWSPEPRHAGGGGFLCGGVIGTLLDCHTGAAVWWWVRETHGAWPDSGGEGAPSYLTAGYEISLLRPTPLDEPVELYAEVREHDEPDVIATGSLESGGKRRAEVVARWRRFRAR